MGVILTTYKSWDDPPSSSGIAWLFLRKKTKLVNFYDSTQIIHPQETRTSKSFHPTFWGDFFLEKMAATFLFFSPKKRPHESCRSMIFTDHLKESSGCPSLELVASLGASPKRARPSENATSRSLPQLGCFDGCAMARGAVKRWRCRKPKVKQ